MTIIGRALQLTNADDPLEMSYRGQATETASIVALAVGLDNFKPYLDAATQARSAQHPRLAPPRRGCR